MSAVFVIPRDVVRRGKEVQVVAADGLYYRRTLSVVWKNDDFIVAESGLQPGDRISRTIVPFATDGIRVRIAGGARTPAGQKLKER